MAERPTQAYRTREYLTEAEMAKLLAALKRSRHGQRNWLIGLLIYRHGLRFRKPVIYAGMISILPSARSSSDDSRVVPIAPTIWSGTSIGR